MWPFRGSMESWSGGEGNSQSEAKRYESQSGTSSNGWWFDGVSGLKKNVFAQTNLDVKPQLASRKIERVMLFLRCRTRRSRGRKGRRRQEISGDERGRLDVWALSGTFKKHRRRFGCGGSISLCLWLTPVWKKGDEEGGRRGGGGADGMNKWGGGGRRRGGQRRAGEEEEEEEEEERRVGGGRWKRWRRSREELVGMNKGGEGGEQAARSLWRNVESDRLLLTRCCSVGKLSTQRLAHLVAPPTSSPLRQHKLSAFFFCLKR